MNPYLSLRSVLVISVHLHNEPRRSIPIGPGQCLAAEENKLASGEKGSERKLLYVAVPGIRNYLEYGGHGLLVFDIDARPSLRETHPHGGLERNGKPLNVKGICASAATGGLYVSTTQHA